MAASLAVDPASVVEAWVERVWTAGDLDAIDEFHPSQFLNDGQPSSPDEARAWHRRMRTAFPDLRFSIDDLFEADGRVVVRWTATGTHHGALWGRFGPTGKGVRWHGIHVVTVQAGQISEVWAASNLFEIAEQLGLELVSPSR